MLEHDLDIEDLLGDSVHQTRYAARMTVMNIARRLHRAERFLYDPLARERRVELEASPAVQWSGGPWTAAKGGSARCATAKDSALRLRFSGNRVELIGWRGPDGGAADVRIDGRPAAQADAFYAGYIQPDQRNAPFPPNPPRDRCPHAITLGKTLVPQQWTMTMINDTGDYELVGSVTGPDGQGSAFKPFTSRSGQILVEPEFWRDAKNNRTGDRFSFDVAPGAVASVDFKAPVEERFRLRLATSLSNGEHVIQLVARGDGALTVDAMDVFEPPLR
jgi:hypothetical protein